MTYCFQKISKTEGHFNFCREKIQLLTKSSFEGVCNYRHPCPRRHETLVLAQGPKDPWAHGPKGPKTSIFLRKTKVFYTTATRRQRAHNAPATRRQALRSARPLAPPQAQPLAAARWRPARTRQQQSARRRPVALRPRRPVQVPKAQLWVETASLRRRVSEPALSAGAVAAPR